jgi:type I restriction enzyme, S subunit
MTDTDPKTLGNYFHVKHGFAFKGEYFSDEATPDVLVTPGNFAIGGGFQEGKPKYYVGPILEDYVLQEGDLVVTMTDLSKAGDTLGYPALIPASPGRKYLHNQRIGLIELRDERKADKRFLFYRLRASDYRHHVLATASGSTVRHTSPGRICSFEATLPNIEEQRAIASVLGALDDKIEQNRRTAQAVEKLARAIFHAWFVDFEPVKAKAAGATSFPSMPQPVFDALPTCFVDSDIGPVPEGWMAGAIKDLAALSKAQVKPQERPEENFDHFSIPAFDAGMRAVVEPGSAIKSNKFLVVDGCVLLSKLNPRIARVWLPPLAHDRRQIASTEFLVFVPDEASDRHYLYCQLQQREFREELAQNASGTSNSHQRVQPKDVLSHPIVMPAPPIRNAFANIAGPLFALQLKNHNESVTLAEMRDYLLPKLLNGRVRVSTAEDYEARS